MTQMERVETVRPRNFGASYDWDELVQEDRVHHLLYTDAAVFDAFRRVLYDRCLIYGGLASESATTTLIDSALERLVSDRVNHWRLALVDGHG